VIENKFSSEGFLANSHWLFSPLHPTDVVSSNLYEIAPQTKSRAAKPAQSGQPAGLPTGFSRGEKEICTPQVARFLIQ